MSGNTSKIIAFNYFGGKFTFLKQLYSNFPNQNQFIHLVDLFGGSFSVSLNYKGKILRTANEINQEITNFFEVLRDHENELVNKLLLTPCSKAEFEKCWTKCEDPIERARRFYVRIRQSFFGLGAQRQNKGWHMAKTKVNAHGGETVSRWNNAIGKLHHVAKEIRSNFQITNYDYLDAIDRIDFKECFFYCDPPYLDEVRNSKNDYLFEFTTDDHINLAERLNKIDGLAMVSGYDHHLYDELYPGWIKVKFPIKKNNIRSGDVQEVIWMNYEKEESGLFNVGRS